MSIELFKGLVYKDNKVYTRQCSNNINPKSFYREENKYFSKLYNELGEKGFEKWFLFNCIMQGDVKVMNGSNNTLRRLNYFSNLLCKDKEYIKLMEKDDTAFAKTLGLKNKNDREVAEIEYRKLKEEMEKYVSSFYDNHISKYKNKEKER